MSLSRITKNLIGLLAIPLVSSAAFSLFEISKDFFKVSRNSFYLPAGIIAYILVRFSISKLGLSIMEFVEVFYHELIHAFYSVISFKDVKSFFASATKGGEIETSKSNFIIELSPYFFPLLALIFSGVKPFVVEKFQVYLIFCTGLGIGLHLSSLFHDLKVEQSDIRRNGVLFSFVVIFFLNIIFFGIIFGSLNSNYAKVEKFFIDSIGNFKMLVKFLLQNFS